MELIVVQYFYDLTALSLAENHLKAAGIPTITRDTFTTQVSGLEARALGGAKLLVRKKDYERASLLLIEGGFMNANVAPSRFWLTESLDQIASLLPGLGQQPRELRLVVITFILFSLVLSITFAVLLM